MMGKRILVVDDEENIRQLYKEELLEDGYEVFLATNGEEAIRMVDEVMPDLVTLDVRMPGMDGIEALRAIKEKNRELPMIMCTAYPEYKHDFGVWASEAYVVKSSDLKELKDAIKKILGT
ncbi:MAG: response regulator [Nitrospirae bacterium]|nr:response regulator [Nitrospirota bacterium]MBI5694270.1 response regulator [Nitrospirota bacterium]